MNWPKMRDAVCYHIWMIAPAWFCYSRVGLWMLQYAGPYGYGWYDLPESERTAPQQGASNENAK